MDGMVRIQPASVPLPFSCHRSRHAENLRLNLSFAFSEAGSNRAGATPAPTPFVLPLRTPVAQLWREAIESIAFGGAPNFLLQYSAQKSHVKPPNDLTPYHPTTSAWQLVSFHSL
jgi:hypothetical protein